MNTDTPAAEPALPADVERHLKGLTEACKKAGLPVLSLVGSGKNDEGQWDLEIRVSNVEGELPSTMRLVAEIVVDNLVPIVGPFLAQFAHNQIEARARAESRIVLPRGEA